jgi:CMP-N,N'-diacetyllegionaminic acid synthase
VIELRTLAIIPARAGSKGILGKNKRLMCGQPLISWTIAAAQAAHSVDEIVVSTDDEETADIAVGMGISVPFLRPAELAQDDTPGIEPVLHTLSLMRDFDSVVLLQPTSPLRTSADIDAIVDLANVRQASSVVSVCETKEPIQWNFTTQADGSLNPLLDGEMIHRRQDAQVTYTLNGALYYFNVSWFLAGKTFIDNGTLPYIMPHERSIDIDSGFDWKIAEFLLISRGA